MSTTEENIITVAEARDYRIHQDAISFQLNALSNPDYLSVSMLAGTAIAAYRVNVIGYGHDLNYQKWTLEAANTYFETPTPKFVYAELDAHSSRAKIVYPSEEVDMVAYDPDEPSVPARYYILLGKITASEVDGAKKAREWDMPFRFGELSTDFGNRETSSGVTILRSEGDDRAPTDENVFSALRTLLEIRLWFERNIATVLQLIQEWFNTTVINFKQGITIGNYIPGYVGGQGAAIDKDGNAEFRNLKVHDSMEVTTFTFNRIAVTDKESWSTNGLGEVESVNKLTATTGIVKLKLTLGEPHGFFLRDYIRGVYHRTEGNSEVSGFDSAGFESYKGFSTAYFTPTRLIGDDSFEYALRLGTTVHPEPHMNIVQYGNADNKERQQSMYQTNKYQRYLKGVNTWVISDRNIASMYGDLSGITINGVAMDGYSSYQNNIYFDGSIQFSPSAADSFRGQDAYSVTLTTYSDVIRVGGGYKEAYSVVSNGKDVVSNGKQVVTEYSRYRTQIQARRGNIILRQEEGIGEQAYTASFTTQGCTATLSGGELVITNMFDDAITASVDIIVNCEGFASYEMTYTLTKVYDGEGFETIFYRSNSDQPPVIPPEENNPDFPEFQVLNYTPTGWTDDSQGVDINNRYVYWAKREKINSRWEAFGDINLLTKYGVDGQGAQYIYKLTKTNTKPSTPPNNIELSTTRGEWTDNFSSPDNEFKYEWVSVRHRIDEVWSDYTDPVLYDRFVADGKDGINGDGSFTSQVFYNSANKPQAPYGGSYSGDPNEEVMPFVYGSSSLKWSDDPVKSETLTTWVSIATYIGHQSIAGGAITWTNSTGWSTPEQFLGKDGASAIRLDLTNENVSVAVDKDSNIVGGNPYTDLYVYEGSSVSSGWSYSRASDGCTSSLNGSRITITSISSDNATVTVTASKSGYTSLTAIMTISRVKPGADGSPATIYYLSPNYNVIKINKDGSSTPSSGTRVYPYAKKQVGDSISSISNLTEGVQVLIAFVDLNGTQGSFSEFGYWNIDAGVKSYSAVIMELRVNNSTWDRETIPIIIDGKDGNDGVNGASGPGLVSCGDWEYGVQYYSTAMRRDVVKYNGVAYAAKRNNINVVPSSSLEDWEQFDGNFKMVATDVLWAEVGNIGGFIYEGNGIMRSQYKPGSSAIANSVEESALVINGRSGQIISRMRILQDDDWFQGNGYKGFQMSFAYSIGAGVHYSEGKHIIALPATSNSSLGEVIKITNLALTKSGGGIYVQTHGGEDMISIGQSKTYYFNGSEWVLDRQIYEELI